MTRNEMFGVCRSGLWTLGLDYDCNSLVQQHRFVRTLHAMFGDPRVRMHVRHHGAREFVFEPNKDALS